MADAGLMFACFGCCCGHTNNGAARIARPATRRVFDAAGLQGKVRFAFSECLGPCSEANVVFVYVHGRALWFRRMNSPELFTELLHHIGEAIADPTRPLPPTLAPHSFVWAGGGVGPEPPVADPEAQRDEGAA